MACEENPFALLGDDEGDDFSTLLARVAMKTDASSAAAEKKQEQKGGNWHSQYLPLPPRFSSRRHPPADYVRAENGRGTGGQGRGSGRSSCNDIQQFGNGYSNGYQRNNRGSNGYRLNNGGADGYRRDGRRANGYTRNGGGFDGYHRSYGTGGKDDGNRQGLGHRREGAKGRSDSGQGRALAEDIGVHTVSQFAEDNQQLNTLEQGENTNGGWETVTGGPSFKNKQLPRNWNSSFGGGRRGNGYGGGFRARGGRSFGASDERKYGNGASGRRNCGSGEVMNNSTTKEAGLGGDHDVNGNYGTGNVDAITEVSEGPSQDYSREEAAQDEETKEAIRKAEEEASGKAQEREQKQKEWEARRKVQEEEAKKMTLEQYQKLLLEKRKALESLKTEERKVTLDRDFESMQLGGKKKEDSLFIKQDSEKGKRKNKDEKNRKVSITEFLKPAVGGQGQGLGGYRRGTSSSSRQAAGVPANGSVGQNELLKRNVGQEHVEHASKSGGGGRHNRGSQCADSTTRDDDDGQHHEEIVKPVLAIGDTSQFPDLGGVALKSS